MILLQRLSSLISAQARYLLFLVLSVAFLFPTDTLADDTPPEMANDLRAFVDTTLAQTMGEHEARGAIVVAVRDDELVVNTGRGYAFFDDAQPVDPDDTLFRIGSVAKVITYIAAMQLIDRGAIDPDADITRYLQSVGVDASFDVPITLKHLATHTAGFGTGAVGITNNRDHLRPRVEILENPRAPRLRAPGDLPGYGNYATELTAQLISDESGMEFEEYVRQNVFKPIGMENSTFEQDPKASWSTPGNGSTTIDLFSQMPAAGGMNATASDMGQLMLALLKDGTTDEGRILSEDGTANMLNQWFTPHEALEGAGFGFWRQRRGDHVLLFHGGGIGSFRSHMILAPEKDFGLFVSYHGGAGGGSNAYFGMRDFMQAFLGEVLPVEKPDLPEKGNAHPNHAGTYVSLEHLQTERYEKLLFMGDSPPLTASVDNDGFLLTDGGENRWFRTDTNVYHRTDGEEALAFRNDDSNLYLFRGSESLRTYQQVEFWQQPMLHGWALLLSLIALLSGVIGWPIAAGWRRYQGTTSNTTTNLYRAKWVVGGAFGSLLLFILAFIGMGVTGAIFQPPSWLPVLAVLPILVLICTGTATWFTGRAWLMNQWALVTRLHYSSIVFGLWIILWLLYYWNLFVPTTG